MKKLKQIAKDAETMTMCVEAAKKAIEIFDEKMKPTPSFNTRANCIVVALWYYKNWTLLEGEFLYAPENFSKMNEVNFTELELAQAGLTYDILYGKRN